MCLGNEGAGGASGENAPQEMRKVFEELVLAPAANIKRELDTLGQRLGSARGFCRCELLIP
jgi:hypothetical protein